MNTHIGRVVAGILNSFILGVMWGYSIKKWFELPGRVPMHFGFSGTPTWFSTSTLVTWFLLPAVTTLLAVFILWMTGWVIRRYPGLINWSNDAQRRAFMSLSDADKEPVLKLFFGIGLWMSAYVSGWFFYLHYTTFQVAASRWSGLPIPFPLDLVPLIIFMAVLLIDLNRKLQKYLSPPHLLQENAYRVK